MEPNTSQLPATGTVQDTSVQTERLLVASRLATDLAGAHSVEAVAAVAVRLLHESFDYYLAVVQRLDGDGYLRVVSGAGPLAEEFTDFLATEQPVEIGVNGRVARSGPRRWSTTPGSTPTTWPATRAPTPARSSRCRSPSPARSGG